VVDEDVSDEIPRHLERWTRVEVARENHGLPISGPSS
jgi:hypothetical protein